MDAELAVGAQVKPVVHSKQGAAVERVDVLHHIDRDRELKDEILTRISEEPDIGDRLLAAAPRGRAAAAPPAAMSADRARDLIERPSAAPEDLRLRAVILRLGRPLLLVRDDDVDLNQVGTDTWKARLEPAHTFLRSAIRSVGRIELDHNPQFDWVGTGWVVAEDVIVTNRHVAEMFARRAGEKFLFRSSMLGQMEARLDFREEHQGNSDAEFRIIEVLHIEEDPGPDMAFLRIDWASNQADTKRPPIPLATTLEPTGGVALIGYPAKDTRTRIPEEMDRIFGNVYDVKRLAPGEITGIADSDRIVTDDCTSSAGCSGSTLVNLERGNAIGLHFAGREEVANYAVSAPVVLARLQQVLSAAAVPGPLVVSPPQEPGAPTAEDLAGRKGYDRDFLGVTVDHPALSPALGAALAPVVGREDGILNYSNFSIRMHRHRRLAIYTAVNIDGVKSRNVRRSQDVWNFDPRLDTGYQVGAELYTRNKLDRGHLVRRLDPAWGDSLEEAEAAARDTFFYTNCCPQHEILNQKLWLGLEDYILTNSDVQDLRVSVFTGPVFRDDDRRYRDLLIPEDFWKVVAVVNSETGRLSVTGYLLSQRDFMNDLEFTFGPYLTYEIPVAQVEQQTGLHFGDLKQYDPIAELETFDVRPLSDFADIRL